MASDPNGGYTPEEAALLRAQYAPGGAYDQLYNAALHVQDPDPYFAAEAKLTGLPVNVYGPDPNGSNVNRVIGVYNPDSKSITYGNPSQPNGGAKWDGPAGSTPWASTATAPNPNPLNGMNPLQLMALLGTGHTVANPPMAQAMQTLAATGNPMLQQLYGPMASLTTPFQSTNNPNPTQPAVNAGPTPAQQRPVAQNPVAPQDNPVYQALLPWLGQNNSPTNPQMTFGGNPSVSPASTGAVNNRAMPNQFLPQADLTAPAAGTTTLSQQATTPSTNNSYGMSTDAMKNALQWAGLWPSGW